MLKKMIIACQRHHMSGPPALRPQLGDFCGGTAVDSVKKLAQGFSASALLALGDGQFFVCVFGGGVALCIIGCSTASLVAIH